PTLFRSPRSGCCTGPCANVTLWSALCFSVIGQKFEPRPVGADTYAADLPSRGTRIDGSAPPPARIIGRLKVGTGVLVRADAGSATMAAAVSDVATAAATIERGAGLVGPRRRCRRPHLSPPPAQLLPRPQDGLSGLALSR